MRLLAAELGEHGVKVNGINPDGVVRGSGIFAGGWGAKRAAVYGVPEEELGAYYAQRTLLKREVLPEHVANAVFVLCVGRPQPHHRPAHPGRRRRRCRLPAMSRAPAAADGPRRDRHRRVERAGGRRRRRATAGSSCGRCTGSPTSRSRADGRLRWDLSGLFAEVLAGLARLGERLGDVTASASTPGPSTTGCSTRRAAARRARPPTATSGPRRAWPRPCTSA